MRIQHNITAMNSYRNYNNNNAKLGKNLEKLSSGYAINRAGDDAAGLAISEKMRAQVTGIEVAYKNAKDGISVVQTAEGALTEVHSMLNRMFALAEQANNGIYQKEEREKLQSEIDQLTTEIDRIGDSTNFNGMKLLDGTLSEAPLPKATTAAIDGTSSAGTTGAGFKWSSTATATVKADFNKALTSAGKDLLVTTIFTAGKATAYRTTTSTFTVAHASTETGYTHSTTTTGTNNHRYTTASVAHKYELKINLASLTNYTIKNATIAGSDITNTGTGASERGVVSSKKELYLSLNDTQKGGGTIKITLQDKDNVEVGTLTFDYGEVKVDNTKTYQQTKDYSDKITLADQTDPNSAVSQGALTLQIGDSTNAYDKMGLSIDSMKAASLNIKGLDIITNPTDAMGRVKSAIETVSVQRGTLGAYQNRLEHTLNNLSVMRENIQDAEATIRDTDMAEEMMKYTKNNILVQSAQAMLAQSNQLPQGVLSLLQ